MDKTGVKFVIKSSATGTKTLGWEEIYDLLVAFKNKSSVETIEFPSSLSSIQRRDLHMMAGRLGLDHDSVGQGNHRHIVISHPKDKTTKDEEEEEEEQKEEEEEKGNSNPKKKRFDKIPFGMSEIIPGFLYLGSMRDAYDREHLKLYKVKYIVNCAKEAKNFHAEDKDLVYCNGHLLDIEDQDLGHKIEELIEFIARARQEQACVLVHCIIGKSRSASIVLAYLMKELKMTLREAYDHVKSKRPIIQPNEGFMKQLLALELALYAKNTMQSGDWVPLFLPQKAPKKEKMNARQIQEYTEEFIKQFITPSLIERGVEEACDGSYEKKKVGTFMNWIAKTLSEDPVVTETLEQRGLKWKDVSKRVNDAARVYFVQKMEQQQR